MLVFIFILVALICSGLSAAKKNEFYKDYCSKKTRTQLTLYFQYLYF